MNCMVLVSECFITIHISSNIKYCAGKAYPQKFRFYVNHLRHYENASDVCKYNAVFPLLSPLISIPPAFNKPPLCGSTTP